MTNTKPKPGVLKDPWRTAVKPTAPSTSSDPRLFKQATLEKAGGVGGTVGAGGAGTGAGFIGGDVSPEEDLSDSRATITLPGYGAIAVQGVRDTPDAVARILNFLIQHHKLVEPTLLQYGVLLTHNPTLQRVPVFSISRSDGWMLAVPGVVDRQQGLLQLIQSFIHFNAQPALKKHLVDAGIRAYKF